MVGVPFAASRVFDELASLAHDTAPGTRRRKCGQKSLDRADDVIDGAEFFSEFLSRNTRLMGSLGSDCLRIVVCSTVAPLAVCIRFAP